MTDTVEVALIAGFVSVIGTLPATLTALASYRQSVKNGAKTDRVFTQVNGNLDQVKAELAAVRAQNDVLTERLITKKAP